MGTPMIWYGTPLMRNGDPALNQECCCPGCSISATITEVQIEFEDAVPEPLPEPPDSVVPENGFLIGITVSDCRNLAGRYLVSYWFIQCEEDPYFLDDIYTWMIDTLPIVAGPLDNNTFLSDFDSDGAIDQFFTDPSPSCDDFWVQVRYSYTGCCAEPFERGEAIETGGPNL